MTTEDKIAVLTGMQQKYQHNYLEILIHMNILHVKKDYFLIEDK